VGRWQKKCAVDFGETLQMNDDIKGRIQELREKTEEMRGYL